MKKQTLTIFSLALVIICLLNCTKKDQNAPANSGSNALFAALPDTVPVPPGNPQTPQKIALGKLLFWDTILSGAKDVACASCHHPSSGYSDNLDLAIGSNGAGLGSLRHFLSPNDIPFAKRNTQTIVNTAFNGMDASGVCNPVTAPMFFDKRTSSLELQSLEPMKTMEEMTGHQFTAITAIDSIIKRLQSIPEYVQLFNDAFGNNSITADNVGNAIACFERTLIANNSPYDKYARGNASALSAAQIQGMNAFQTNGCSNCHSGPMFSDYLLHVLSVPDNSKRPNDKGANATFAFRTPTLRNLAVTAPYMHSGVFASLDDVLAFYDRIGDGNSQNPQVRDNQLDNKLQRINNRDRQNIIQFLNSLNDTGFDKTIPVSVPSHLHVGGNI